MTSPNPEMDASEFTVTLTADEFALATMMAAKHKGKTATDLFGKLIAVGIERMRQIESETILDSDLVFEPSGRHGVK